MDKLVRRIPEPVLEVLTALAPRRTMPETKSGSERPNSNEIVVHTLCIRALKSPYWYQVAEIEDIALRIAQLQRKTSEMHERAIAYKKLVAEQKELAILLSQDASKDEVMYRAASVVYYIAYSFLHHHEIATFHAKLDDLAHQACLPKELLMLICLAKFRLRAIFPIANKPLEKQEVERCATSFLENQKLVVKTLD